MTQSELYEALCELEIPVAYDHFEQNPSNNKVVPPFVVYRNTDPTTVKADDITYYKHNNYIIDLVTDKKDVGLEEDLEKILTDNDMPFDVEENYIDSERIYQIRYYTN